MSFFFIFLHFFQISSVSAGSASSFTQNSLDAAELASKMQLLGTGVGQHHFFSNSSVPRFSITEMPADAYNAGELWSPLRPYCGIFPLN